MSLTANKGSQKKKIRVIPWPLGRCTSIWSKLMHNEIIQSLTPPSSLTLSMCGCVWWAAGWAALQAVAVSSPSPKPDCPPSRRGRRDAGGFEVRWAAVRGSLVGRHQGLTSWLLMVRNSCFSFSPLFLSLSVFGLLQWRREKKEGHTSCMAVCVCEAQRGDLTGRGVGQSYPAMRGRGVKKGGKKRKDGFIKCQRMTHILCEFH